MSTMGRVLWVDLTEGRIDEEQIPQKVYQQVLSGAGLAAWISFSAIPRGADPLGPDNVIGFVSGLLSGTGAPMVGRWMVTGKSPLTGGWGEANGGGYFAPAIKRAGYDGIFVQGVSHQPVYLRVVDGKADLADASQIWGLDTVATEQRIQEENHRKDLRIACIGPAGERLSLISGIVTDGARIAARSGMGAVMGSKRLKAVALSGNAKIEVHDPETIRKLSKDFSDWVRAGEKSARWMTSGVTRILSRFMRVSPVAFGGSGEMVRSVLRNYGTIVTNVISSETGDSPVKNWKGSGYRDFPIATHSSRLEPARILANQQKRYHCHSCPIGCGGILDLSGKTRFPLSETHKPEYETCSAFGSLILNNDLDALFMVNDLLNRAGMDTISAGSAVAFAMECVEQGILGPKETDGLDLRWGNAGAVVELVKKMIDRVGVGEVLADGTAKAAERIGKGSGALAMHAGGQDLPMHDGRLDPGFAVSYSMEPTPARHTNYSYMYLELFGLHKIFPGLPAVDMIYRKSSRLSTKQREILLSAASRFMQVVNGAGACLFAVQCGPRYPLVESLNAATGWNRKPQEYLEIGERIQHLRQAFNVKHGKVPRRDFRLPRRAIGEPPLSAGPLKGIRVPIEALEESFAKAMGWDDQGRPLPERLKALGLAQVAQELHGPEDETSETV
jgi:aldehyde:ferredoxin oxidoreductase